MIKTRRRTTLLHPAIRVSLLLLLRAVVHGPERWPPLDAKKSLSSSQTTVLLLLLLLLGNKGGVTFRLEIAANGIATNPLNVFRIA
jgi:hypothetical protein